MVDVNTVFKELVRTQKQLVESQTNVARLEVLVDYYKNIHNQKAPDTKQTGTKIIPFKGKIKKNYR
jgi:hypothetical protein